MRRVQESVTATYGAKTPIDVILPEKLGDPVQPDIIFIRRERLQIVADFNIRGAPVLVGQWVQDEGAGSKPLDGYAVSVDGIIPA